MYDKGKIISGLVIFVALVLMPFWWQAGTAAPKPEPQLPKGEKVCVETKELMRTKHMQILNDWRNDVVRDADRIYVADNGKKFEMSLSNECMRCHNDKEKFCDKCHNYMGVNPYCWDCHLTPAEKEGK